MFIFRDVVLLFAPDLGKIRQRVMKVKATKNVALREHHSIIYIIKHEAHASRKVLEQ